MFDAPFAGMTLEHTVTISGNNGHIATISYALAKEGGWDVRAQVDDRIVAVRHCAEWHNVERLHDWLRAQLQ
jgi:hypothetical protein